MIIYIYLLVFHLFGTPVDSKEVKTTFGTYINKNFNFLLNHLNLQKLSVSESNILPHVLPSLSSNQIHSAGSVTGFLQAIYYPNDVACSKTNGAYTLDLAIGTCLPVKNILNTIANSYILLDDGSGGINAYLFSDTKCRTTAGIPVSVPSSTFKVCTDGVKYLLTTGSSPPPPPFTSQSYGSIM